MSDEKSSKTQDAHKAETAAKAAPAQAKAAERKKDSSLSEEQLDEVSGGRMLNPQPLPPG